jgi:peptidoglycan hydrolase-like amidase
MLKPLEIPKKEPRIRVGIILPEDNRGTVTLKIADDREYLLHSNNFRGTISDTEFHTFRQIEDTIHFEERKAASWYIIPKEVIPVKPKSGILIKDVIAGRGFHWEKPIDICISGDLEIKIFNRRLILINELPLESYLMCVATSEMGASCPAPLLESQTIAARSWMLANIEQKHVALTMDVCNDDCCQRYQGNANLTTASINAAVQTHGQVLIYNNKICDARYSKSCGGKMESFSQIWKGPDLPYLTSLPDAPVDFKHPAIALSTEPEVVRWIDDIPATFCSPHYIPERDLKKYLGSVDEQGTYFRWKFEYTQMEITRLLNNKLNRTLYGVNNIIPIKRGGSGRITKLKIIVIGADGKVSEIMIESEYKIRQILHSGFLYSSCFYISALPGDTEIPETFIIKGAGWGHGAGYCQIGALGMALSGYNTEEILAHYYPGSELKKIY